ncbi:MAG: anti-sigma factor domain-containing protein [Clostridiales bacterium]|jgi:hypothetical protein|nr:anti-sigma factor domain-containing protein [Clostridiales bacterium]
MKAVVVEIKKNYAAVLSDNGCILKVKNNNYEIGQVIYINNKEKSIRKKILTFAASAAALLILGTGTWAYAAPYSYVSLDVNPSIEFTVNRFDRVLRVKAVNDDGEELLKDINLSDLKNETINNALSATIEQISAAGYFEGDIEAGLIIATSAKNTAKAEKLVEELQETVDSELVEQGKEVEVEAISIGYERVQEAKKLGVTPGKLNLVEKLQASAQDPETIDIEEWLSKPVKEIMKATKDNKKGAKSLEDGLIIDPQEDDANIEVANEDATKEETLESKKAAISARKEAKEAEKAARKEQKEAEKAARKAQKEEKKTSRISNSIYNNDENKEIRPPHNTDRSVENTTKTEDVSLNLKEKSEKAAEKIDKKAEKAEEKADKVAEKANEKAEKAAEKANEKADKTAEKANEKAEKAAEKANEKAEKAAEKENKKSEKFDQKAKDKKEKNSNKSNITNNNSKSKNNGKPKSSK